MSTVFYYLLTDFVIKTTKTTTKYIYANMKYLYCWFICKLLC